MLIAAREADEFETAAGKAGYEINGDVDGAAEEDGESNVPRLCEVRTICGLRALVREARRTAFERKK